MHQPEIVGKLISIQVSQPATHGEGDSAWTTSIFKQPVTSPVSVGPTSLQNDAPADTKHHGGIDKAVLAYSLDHHAEWETELATDVPPGSFGENLSVMGVDEMTTCIGDRWSIGTAVFEVSQPRQPCWKLGRRWNRSDLPKLILKNQRGGWYFRVVETGEVSVGDSVTLIARPQPAWTVAQAFEVYYSKDDQAKQRLAEVPELSKAWRDDLTR